MSQTTLALLLIFILLILMGFIVFLIINLTSKTRLNKKWQNIKNKIPLDTIKKVDSTLNRVDTIAQANDRYVEVNNKILQIYDDIQRELKTINKYEARVENLLKSKKIIKDEVMSAFQNVEAYIIKTQKMFKAFFNVANEVIHQDKFMRNEFAFYQKHLRKVVSTYLDNKTNYWSLHIEIDKLIIKIEKLEKEFDKLIIMANNNKGSEVLRKYGYKVLELIKVLNEVPSINTFLEKRLEQSIKDIEKLYKVYRQKIKIENNWVNFDKTIAKVKNWQVKAQKNFKALNIDKTKQTIQEIYKVLKDLKHSIHLEMKAHDVFYRSYSLVILEVEQVLVNFMNTKQWYLAQVNGNFKTNLEIEDEFAHVERLSTNLKKLVFTFKETKSKIAVSYSSKILSTETLVALGLELNDRLNTFINHFQEDVIQQKILNDKFQQICHILKELNNIIEKDNIKLTNIQSNAWKELLVLKDEIDLANKKPVNRQLILLLNNFTHQFLEFYLSIHPTIEASLIVKNMIQELTRSEKNKIKHSAKIEIIKQNYAKGKYIFSLNGIIGAIQKWGI